MDHQREQFMGRERRRQEQWSRSVFGLTLHVSSYMVQHNHSGLSELPRWCLAAAAPMEALKQVASCRQTTESEISRAKTSGQDTLGSCRTGRCCSPFTDGSVITFSSLRQFERPQNHDYHSLAPLSISSCRIRSGSIPAYSSCSLTILSASL